MTTLVGYILLFTGIGVGFVFANLTLGKLLRPAKMDAEKGTIYECGEPTIGSAWIQFDLRFYVVALLFVIFDVEMAFFFPWAVVFGQNVAAADAGNTAAQTLAWVAFGDILFFFGVLLVGFAYLWRRGDLDWVRSLAAQSTPKASN
ncbi:MAG: NADH-quinone oxidoreductase subunit A [Gemmataceae bacterium]|nr:NADH-quinone oxidoreductase subunit A [Gemmataceae bacterium]